MLHGDRKTMLQVAMDVGYGSEAALQSRVQARVFGLPPAQYRQSDYRAFGADEHRAPVAASHEASLSADVA